jgi:putative membrane protein
MLGATNVLAGARWPSRAASLKALGRGGHGLRFLKTLFWIVVAALVTLFAARNWRDVTIDLWGNLQADIKVPIVLAIAFLIGLVPTWLIFRAKLWRATNRAAIAQREVAMPVAEEPSELDA